MYYMYILNHSFFFQNFASQVKKSKINVCQGAYLQNHSSAAVELVLFEQPLSMYLKHDMKRV